MEKEKDKKNIEKNQNKNNEIKEQKEILKEENKEYETIPNEQKFDEVEEKIKKKRTDSYFDGSLIELIGYHLLSGIITIFTLGIGRPWAECLVMGYKINHTVYNGKRLKFEGKGSNYFVQKFKWLFFTIITLGIYSFWIPINKVKWQVKNIHYEDEEHITDDSYFDGKLIQLIGINLLSWLIITVSFGILYPFVHCMKIRWITKHTIINRKKLTFKGSALNLFAHYLLWTFLTIITFGIYGLWLGINYMKWQTKNTHIKMKDEIEEENKNEIIISIIIVAIIFIIGSIIIGTILANFKSTPNLEAEQKMKTTIINAQTEFSNKQYTAEEVEKWSKSNNRISLQSTKKLKLDSLNEFTKTGGYGLFTYNDYYSSDNRQIELILKYKNMVCISELNSNQTYNKDNKIECRTLTEIIDENLKIITPNTNINGKAEMVNEYNNNKTYNYNYN